MRATPSRIAAAAAVLLLAVGAWVSSSAEGGKPGAERRIDFPTHPRGEEWSRIEKRKTLPARAPIPGEEHGDEREQIRDPFLKALPIEDGDAFVVMEANALRHSRLGELFVQCILAEQPDAFREITKETGIDPLKDVDRVAFAGEALVLSGFFDRVRWDAFEKDTGARSARYGDEATIWTTEGDEEVVGTWRNQLLVVGPAEDVRRAIDQVEGRREPPGTDVSDDMAYGELYGVVPGAAARKLLPAGDEALASRIAAAAQRIELHVDAMQDVAGVVRVSGEPGQEVEDLAKSLGAALSVARLKAAATDDRKLAALLEHAQVVPQGAGFTVELALPADVLQEFFKDCGKRLSGERTE